ncbi:MAG: hypothetical protein WCQ26_04090 [Pseudanabaena sp. ELA748]
MTSTPKRCKAIITSLPNSPLPNNMTRVALGLRGVPICMIFFQFWIDAIIQCRHLGIPENRDFIYLFIATFPVVLDSIFKYWIFCYLSRVSPSAVATYTNMNE